MKKIITILLFSNVCFSMQMDDFKTFFNSISGVWCGKWYPYKISTESYTYKYKPGYSYLLKTNKYYASNIFFAYNTFGIYTGKSLLSPDGDILLNWNDWDFYHIYMKFAPTSMQGFMIRILIEYFILQQVRLATVGIVHGFRQT